jgi:hypothetical protein
MVKLRQKHGQLSSKNWVKHRKTTESTIIKQHEHTSSTKHGWTSSKNMSHIFQKLVNYDQKTWAPSTHTYLLLLLVLLALLILLVLLVLLRVYRGRATGTTRTQGRGARYNEHRDCHIQILHKQLCDLVQFLSKSDAIRSVPNQSKVSIYLGGSPVLTVP